MNLIGLDISKVSTSMVIETKGKNFYFSYNTHNQKYKWNKIINNFVNIKCYEYDNKIENYSESEINKLTQFSKISTDLINDILNTIDKTDETIVNAEGYSYGKSNQIIDLVGIGTIIRVKLIENISNLKINIIAPKSVKTKTCEMVYGFQMIEGKKNSKKVINTNKNNVSGGDFTKFDMMDAINDYNKDDELSIFVKENYVEMFAMKSVPKPIEDLIDAYFLKESLKHF